MITRAKVSRDTPTPREQELRHALRVLKEAGVTRGEAVGLVCKALHRAYQSEGWRSSEYAMAAAEWTAQARRVWP